MNKVFLSGRITSDISRFGTDSKGGVSFSLVTSKPVIKDGQIQKDENGYTETYDEFHTVKRSEERRVGKECVSTCRSRWSPDHSATKTKRNTNQTPTK